MPSMRCFTSASMLIVRPHSRWVSPFPQETQPCATSPAASPCLLRRIFLWRWHRSYRARLRSACPVQRLPPLSGRTELIEKALKVDPNNGMALWLFGTAAFQRNDFDKAVRTWERLVPLPPFVGDISSAHFCEQTPFHSHLKTSRLTLRPHHAHSQSAKLSSPPRQMCLSQASMVPPSGRRCM